MPKLTAPEVDQALAALPQWQLEDGRLARRLRFRDAIEAVGFIVRLAALQERADHHATVTWTYADVTLTLSTHDEGGITEKDVALAREIEARVA